ncbi:MAG: sugar transferase [Patescibacteria group bacterium]|nr:sugar transferase [Patescibacteria group bacterium]
MKKENDQFYYIGKRLFDIFGALVGIIIFSPIMVILSIWIKIVSPEGPVFADIPERVGKDGKLFRMLKFRSMIPNAQAWLDSRPDLLKLYKKNNYKLDPDPRLLPGALVYRKTSMDELPQFFNILKGEMSLVGPRCYYPFEIKDQLKVYPHAKKYLKDVLSAKPGLTGLWQISGRSEINFDDRLRLDAEYARKKSLVYDLLIVLKTPYVVITGKGAY